VVNTKLIETYLSSVCPQASMAETEGYIVTEYMLEAFDKASDEEWYEIVYMAATPQASAELLAMALSWVNSYH
jgi:hypothetical protein